MHSESFGLGLRTEHYQNFIDARQSVDWLEVISENYLVSGGKPLHYLDRIRRDYPMVMHGVSMSIGSTDPINLKYLTELRQLATRIQPEWISDHLCWTGVDHKNLHDLLPMPYTEEALTHLSARIDFVQEFLGRPMVLENVSSYVTYREDEMKEWEFLTELTRRTGCRLLLDVNNVYVSSVNHGFEAREFIDAMPAKSIQQIHLAGHQLREGFIIDTHDADITDEVWSLYSYTIKKLGRIPTMIERDDHIPPLESLLVELSRAQKIAEGAIHEKSY